MDGVTSVDRDVAAEIEQNRQTQERLRMEEASRVQQEQQAQWARQTVETAPDVLGVYVNLTA